MNRQYRVEERRQRNAGEDARERLLAGLPARERRLQLAGVSTAVLEGGDGPPVVLLHGGIESGGVYWAPLISRLAGSHHLVVPDAPGLGESEPVARLDAAFDQTLGHPGDLAGERRVGDVLPVAVALDPQPDLVGVLRGIAGDHVRQGVVGSHGCGGGNAELAHAGPLCPVRSEAPSPRAPVAGSVRTI